MKVYLVIDDIADGVAMSVCAADSLAAVAAKLKQGYTIPDDATDIVWDKEPIIVWDKEPIGEEAKTFGVRWWDKNGGRLVDMNGPLSGPRVGCTRGKSWDFVPFDVIGS